jgi:hypothetical protein
LVWRRQLVSWWGRYDTMFFFMLSFF